MSGAVRHMFNVDTNDALSSWCGRPGGLIRLDPSNVNCRACIGKFSDADAFAADTAQATAAQWLDMFEALANVQVIVNELRAALLDEHEGNVQEATRRLVTLVALIDGQVKRW